MRKQSKTARPVCIVTVALAPQAQAATGPMKFEPIDGSAHAEATAGWTVPLLAPDSSTQRLFEEETTFDIYAGADDLTDMSVTNESGGTPAATSTAPTRSAPTGPSPWSTSRPARRRSWPRTRATETWTG